MRTTNSQDQEMVKKTNLRRVVEKIFALFALLMVEPTNPFAVPFSNAAPEGLEIVYIARTPSEAELVRQILIKAGFHMEYVPPPLTGALGTSGSVCVYVHAGKKESAQEFLSQLQREAGEEKYQEGSY